MSKQTSANSLIDKVAETDKETANVKFQEIAFAYAVLSDPRRRSRYDTTGRTSESLDIEDDDFNWTDFFRTQYKEIVTAEAIERFKKEYIGSEEEQLAIIEAYVNGEGDMEHVFAHVMLSDPLEDEVRFRSIIDAEIAEKRVESYPAYTNESKARKRQREKAARKEAKEAELMAKELGVDGKLFGNKKTNGTANGKKKDNTGAGAENEDLGGLAALIQQRQKSRAGNFLADLEAKYAPKKGKRKAEDDEPPEEAFQKTAERHKRNSETNTAARPIASARKSKRSKQ
jgi:DnaJ family protein C protein 9